MALVEELERATASLEGRATLAVMGCSVNGPGESREADLGLVVSGSGEFLLYRAGRYARKVRREDAAEVALEELGKILERGEGGSPE